MKPEIADLLFFIVCNNMYLYFQSNLFTCYELITIFAGFRFQWLVISVGRGINLKCAFHPMESKTLNPCGAYDAGCKSEILSIG